MAHPTNSRILPEYHYNSLFLFYIVIESSLQSMVISSFSLFVIYLGGLEMCIL